MKVRTLGLAAVLILGSLACGNPARAASAEGSTIDPARYLAHIKFLADDRREGRGSGSKGAEEAAEYIAREFRRLGLEAGGDRGTYSQTFDLVAELRVGEGNELSLAAGDRVQRLRLGRDYFPLSIGPTAARATSTAITLPVVFAGFGIATPELGYDDYAGLEVAGDAVLVFTHEPRERARAGPFDGPPPSEASTVRAKAEAARARGARLLIVVDDPLHEERSTPYDAFDRTPEADELGLPVVRVRRSSVSRWLGSSLDLDAAHRSIAEELRPRSRRLEDRTVRFAERFDPIRRDARNIVGVLRGADRTRRHDAIVLGAHYDHLGRGTRHSMAPDGRGRIHNGADDNASGTAALLEIARVLATRPVRLPRTIVFVAFAAEELGLLGSAYYVNHPTVPLDRTIAMLNLDMIGRPRGRLLISGLDTAPSLEEDVRAAATGVELEIDFFSQSPGMGASDDSSFLQREVPSIAFFTGFHDDYHRPTDDWPGIELAGSVRVVEMALELAVRIAERSETPAFQPVR